MADLINREKLREVILKAQAENGTASVADFLCLVLEAGALEIARQIAENEANHG